MSDHEPQRPPAAPELGPGNRKKRGGSRERATGSRLPQAAMPEERRPRPPTGERRSVTGFGAEIEHAYCAAFHGPLPEGFPVRAREQIATRRVLVVATRPGAVLLCDGAHASPHVWPDGEVVSVPAAEDEALADEVPE